MVVGQGMRLGLIGIAIGVGTAAGLTRLMATLLYDVAPLDAQTFGIVAALLIGVALIACAVPAARAAHVDPLSALRGE